MSVAAVWLPGDEGGDSKLYLQQWSDVESHESFLLACSQHSNANGIAETLKHMEETLNKRVADDVVVGEVTIPAGTLLTEGVTIPLAQAQAESIYQQSEASHLGVEGLGTVRDETLRSSVELAIADDESCVQLPDVLKNFAFLDVRAHLRDALCPTAEEMEVRPYKLVTYAKGDFFTAHVDSMSNEHMFGSLALQIPIVYGPQPSPDGDAAASCIGSGGSDSEAGNLVFYLGRTIDSEDFDERFRSYLYYSRNRGYGRSVVDDVLRLSVDLTTPLPPRPDGAVDLKYAAWLGDVPHEVGRVTQPFRIVLLYRLFKRGHRFRALVPRPIADSISADVRRLVEPLVVDRRGKTIVKATVPTALLPIDDLFDSQLAVQCVGIILRHTYPPAGLKPMALKGVDAAAYQVITATHEVHLLSSVMECRDDFPTQPYRFVSRDEGARYGRFTRRIVLDQRRPTSFGERDYEDTVLLDNPYINAVWLQLGYGQIIGGGQSYGNADCGADWWYRSAAMIVLPRSSKWSRVQPLFLAALRGRMETMKRLYAVQDVFQHVVSFV